MVPFDIMSEKLMNCYILCIESLVIHPFLSFNGN